MLVKCISMKNLWKPKQWICTCRIVAIRLSPTLDNTPSGAYPAPASDLFCIIFVSLLFIVEHCLHSWFLQWDIDVLHIVSTVVLFFSFEHSDMQDIGFEWLIKWLKWGFMRQLLAWLWFCCVFFDRINKIFSCLVDCCGKSIQCIINLLFSRGGIVKNKR